MRIALLTIALPFLLAADDEWIDTFNVPAKDFASVGRNPYFILEPGYQLSFEGNEHGKPATLIITVLDETRTLAGVETRIVEERESVDGQPVEISRNYFAIDKRNNDIYYFGEDVDEYEDGKVTGHGGSWHAGATGARFGLFIPANPKVGQKAYQEIAPDVAMDRFEVKSIRETVKVPAGEFEDCLETEETTPLEADEKAHKFYAPGVGLLIDGSMKLVKYGKSR